MTKQKSRFFRDFCFFKSLETNRRKPRRTMNYRLRGNGNYWPCRCRHKSDLRPPGIHSGTNRMSRLFDRIFLCWPSFLSQRRRWHPALREVLNGKVYCQPRFGRGFLRRTYFCKISLSRMLFTVSIACDKLAPKFLISIAGMAPSQDGPSVAVWTFPLLLPLWPQAQ